MEINVNAPKVLNISIHLEIFVSEVERVEFNAEWSARARTLGAPAGAPDSARPHYVLPSPALTSRPSPQINRRDQSTQTKKETEKAASKPKRPMAEEEKKKMKRKKEWSTKIRWMEIDTAAKSGEEKDDDAM